MKNLVVPAALVCLGLPFTASSASSEEWAFERARGGGFAKVCSSRYKQPVCAVVYCGRGVEGFNVGLTGWEPKGQGESRRGPVEIDAKSREITFVRDNDRIVGEVWRMDVNKGEQRIINRMKSGYLLEIDIDKQSPGFQFSLNNSYDAITELEKRCERRTARRTLGNDNNIIRFGNDDFGIQFRLGPYKPEATQTQRKWVRVASQKANRRRDRDVVDLSGSNQRYQALRFRAVQNDIRVRRIVVEYGNGRQQEVDIDSRVLKEGDQVTLALKGRRGRALNRIVLVYRTRGRGPRAEMEIWGQRAS